MARVVGARPVRGFPNVLGAAEAPVTRSVERERASKERMRYLVVLEMSDE